MVPIKAVDGFGDPGCYFFFEVTNNALFLRHVESLEGAITSFVLTLRS